MMAVDRGHIRETLKALRELRFAVGGLEAR